MKEIRQKAAKDLILSREVSEFDVNLKKFVLICVDVFLSEILELLDSNLTVEELFLKSNERFLELIQFWSQTLVLYRFKSKLDYGHYYFIPDDLILESLKETHPLSFVEIVVPCLKEIGL